MRCPELWMLLGEQLCKMIIVSNVLKIQTSHEKRRVPLAKGKRGLLKQIAYQPVFQVAAWDY